MGSKHCIDSFEVEFKDLLHARHFFHAGNTAVNKTMSILSSVLLPVVYGPMKTTSKKKNVNTQNGLVFNK